MLEGTCLCLLDYKADIGTPSVRGHVSVFVRLQGGNKDTHEVLEDTCHCLLDYKAEIKTPMKC